MRRPYFFSGSPPSDIITFYKIVAHSNFESYNGSLSVALVLESGLCLGYTVLVEVCFFLVELVSGEVSFFSGNGFW